MAGKSDRPRGKMAIRTLAMPKDTNPNGDIFGGWLMSQMDIAGGLTAGPRAGGRVVTVGVEAMAFHRPVHVGDVLSCHANILQVGTTSITVLVEAWVLRAREAESDTLVKVTEGEFTYVAIDEAGVKRAVAKGE